MAYPPVSDMRRSTVWSDPGCAQPDGLRKRGCRKGIWPCKRPRNPRSLRMNGWSRPGRWRRRASSPHRRCGRWSWFRFPPIRRLTGRPSAWRGRRAGGAGELFPFPANPAPDGEAVGMLRTPDGVGIRFARWEPPPGRKGTLCVFPGRAEFIEKYFEVVNDARDRGFAVAMIDWRGQGLSQRALGDRNKGNVRSFSDYDIDLETFVHEIVLPDCPPPLFARWERPW